MISNSVKTRMKKVFLGGTTSDSRWRDYVMPRLRIAFFNPVVPTWNDAAYREELYQRENCDFCLYVITPRMKGFYSIAEVVDDSHVRPEKTIYCYLSEDGGIEFEKPQHKSMIAIGKMIEKNGGKWCQNLDEIVDYLNQNA